MTNVNYQAMETSQETTSVEGPSSQEYSNEDFIRDCVGDFGPWQLKIAIAMALLKLPIAWYQMNIIFLAPPQDFWCAKPESLFFSTYSEEKWRKVCSPLTEPYPCLIFDPEVVEKTSPIDRNMIPLIKCPKFVYDRKIFKRTITSDWDLVCNNHWKIHLTQVVMMFGILSGGLVFGAIADKWGRKFSLTIGIILQGSSGLWAGLTTNFQNFMINRFIIALATGGLSVVSFVISMEVVSGKWRTLLPVICQLPYGLGNTVMAAVAYWTRDWRTLGFVLGVFSSMFLLCLFWVSESPRWLLATGQKEKAIALLRVAAKTNGRIFNEEHVKRLPKIYTKVKTPYFMAFLATKNMRKKTIVLSVIWYICGLIYFSFSQYLGVMEGNIFVTIGVCGLALTPGGLVCIFVVMNFGRKTSIASFEFVTAVCLFGLIFSSKDDVGIAWSMLFFASVGMASLANSVPPLYLFTAELYPTIGRSAAVGAVLTCNRIGSMMAPLLVNLDELMQNFTLILLFVLCFVQILLLTALPETKGCQLPVTIEEAEQFTGCISSPEN